jgi:hypothetical protein
MESLSSFGGKRLVGLWSISRAYGTSRVMLLPLLSEKMENTIIQRSQMAVKKEIHHVIFTNYIYSSEENNAFPVPILLI